MRNKSIIYILVIAIAIGIAWFTHPGEKKRPRDYGFTTSGEDSVRLAKLGLAQTAGKEAGILDTSKLIFPKTKLDYHIMNYLPEPSLNYVLRLTTKNKTLFKKDGLWRVFDLAWRKEYTASDLYGHDVNSKKWTYVIAGDAPDEFDSVMVAINLLRLYNKENAPFQPRKLQEYIDALRKKIAANALTFEIAQQETVARAMERAKTIVQSATLLNRDEIIVLRSGSRFDGKKMWDVLTSLGLRWGDGDLFHWDNEHDYGDDIFFSVWTTTQPGYFLPEDIKDGKMNPADLVFGFTAARCADPKHVLEIMGAAAQYCQAELGGVLEDADGHPLNLMQQ
jgi:cell division protein ZipA